MHKWHFLILAFFAVLQPIFSFTERNSVDGRQQCCEERDNSLVDDGKRSLHGSDRITQERQLSQREIRYERSEHRATRLTIDGRVNRMSFEVEKRLLRTGPQVRINDQHRRERVLGLNREERNRESLRERASLQNSRVLRQNNQQESRDNVPLEPTFGNRREVRRSRSISRFNENTRKALEIRDSIANIRNDLALHSDRRMSKITVNGIKREVVLNSNTISRERQIMNARQNEMTTSKLEINLENVLNTREREQKTSRVNIVDNRRDMTERAEVQRQLRQITTFRDSRQKTRVSRENERGPMSQGSQRDYSRVFRDFRVRDDIRRDTSNLRNRDAALNRNEASRSDVRRNIETIRERIDTKRTNEFELPQTENRRNVRGVIASRNERRIKDHIRFRDIPNEKMRIIRWAEKRSDVIDSRVTRNRDMERESFDSRLHRNERSLSRTNLGNGKQLTTPFEDKSVTWQYLLYSLQTVYLGFFLIKMLSNSGSDKTKKGTFSWWPTTQTLLKVD